MKKFRKVAVGGTFDELHRGHKVLLVKAFEVGEHVLIGLCSDEFVEKMGKPHVSASYKERLKDLEVFLQALGLRNKAEIIPLNDPYGITITDKCIDALVVSEETEKIAVTINQKRIEALLPPLEIVTICMVPAENCEPISTTRIREGEIDREGHMLKNHKSSRKAV
jgi:pantetheine-phosphate adenylyltransferase